MGTSFTYYQIPEAFALKLQGPDASRYLQARLTNDIRLLEEDSSILAAILDAQGKTEGVFTVSKQAEDEFILLADGGEIEEVTQSLLRFKVADQFEATPMEVTSFYCSQLQMEQTSISSDVILIPEPSAPQKRNPDGGCYLLIPNEKLEEITQTILEKGEELKKESALSNRIRGGRPLYPLEISPGRIFLESEIHQAISRTKGCYAGQEVIEKASSRGKLPKTLSVFTTSGSPIPQVGTNIMLQSDRDKIVGTVMSAATSSEQNVILFGLVKTSSSDEPLALEDGRALVSSQ